MRKRMIALMCMLSLAAGMLGGCTKEKTSAKEEDRVEIKVFIAASLHAAMAELAEQFNKEHPETKVVFNADSSGTLLTQMEQGFACDLFFSAAQKQMDALEADGLVVEGTRKNVLNNRVVVIARKDSNTLVTGLKNIAEAKSIALAGGSVPVGKYTRQAMVNLKLIDGAEDASKIEASTIQKKLGTEVSEQSNVSKVLEAVKEGSCEVGTTYYSDIYGYEDQIKVLETVDYGLTGEVVYPICQVKNEEATKAQTKVAKEFYEYVISDKAKAVFEKYYFDTNVQ